MQKVNAKISIEIHGQKDLQIWTNEQKNGEPVVGKCGVIKMINI